MCWGFFVRIIFFININDKSNRQKRQTSVTKCSQLELPPSLRGDMDIFRKKLQTFWSQNLIFFFLVNICNLTPKSLRYDRLLFYHPLIELNCYFFTEMLFWNFTKIFDVSYQTFPIKKIIKNSFRFDRPQNVNHFTK